MANCKNNPIADNTNMDNKEEKVMQQNNNNLMEITDSRDASNFLSILPTAEVQESATSGLCLYTPKGSMVNLPLYIRDDEEIIHLIPLDNLPAKTEEQVFGEEGIDPKAQYSFDKKLLLKVFEEEPEYIPDFIAILEMYECVSGEEVLKLLLALKEESLELVNILRVLSSLTPDDLEALMDVAEFQQNPLRQYFIELEGQVTPKDEE